MLSVLSKKILEGLTENFSSEKILVEYINTKDFFFDKSGIFFSICGIFRESFSANFSFEEKSNFFVQKKDPIFFNVDIIFFVNFPKNRFMELEILEEIISFFHINSIFLIEEDFSKEIFKINLKIQEYKKEEIYNIYSLLSIPYIPSIICNFYSLKIRDKSEGIKTPKIENLIYEAKKK